MDRDIHLGMEYSYYTKEYLRRMAWGWTGSFKSNLSTVKTPKPAGPANYSFEPDNI